MDFTDTKDLNLPLLITLGLLLMIIIYFFAGYSCMRGSCVKPYNQEGFVSPSKDYTNDTYMKYSNTLKPLNTAVWFNPNLNSKQPSKVTHNEPDTSPDSNLFFANTEFKQSCCAQGSAYSNSMGCACLSAKQYNYLIDRGGNNVPHSEY